MQRRVKRHRACASEFDYAGWKAWGRWRRGGVPRRKSSLVGGWGGIGGNGNGIRGGSGAGGAIKKDCWNACDYPSECRWGRKVGIHSPEAPEFDFPQPPVPPPAPNTDLPNEISSFNSDSEQDKALFTSLLASAKRRKSSHPSSPLATPLSPTKDADGDIAMAAAPATVGSVAMDMLKDLMGRKMSGRGERRKADVDGGEVC